MRMNHRQTTNANKLHFHWNTSLTCTNVPKTVYCFSILKPERKAFSTEQIKIIYHDELLLKIFFNVFEIRPNLTNE